MGEQHSGEGASSSDASVSHSDSKLELNLKTLDSRIYSFTVEKNMPVSSFKEIIADQIGVPVGLQRLIFRGKVLKDEHLLSEYHVENGDTLHLVERQPTQEPPPSATGADSSANTGSQGNGASAGIPRSRIGQISHSVVLGSFNVGDQVEGSGSELTRVIGAVLNSLGVGNQGTANGAVGAVNSTPTNPFPFGPVPQGSNVEQELGRSTDAPSPFQSPFGQAFFSQPFSVPLMGASVPPPPLNLPIPDSLNTLSEFMSRMEEVLSQNGYGAPSSTTNSADQPPPGLPSDARGLPTPDALGIVLRQAQRLLSGVTVSALSHFAGRLEQESGSIDTSVRSQIQSDSVQVGLAMQHLGALFLELGRTILMLRMGYSPAEAVINSGPAVYISPSGPNPIMAQPFPHQTSPLFNPPPASAPNSGMPIPVGIVGSAPRNINIHIHAGASLPPVVPPIVARSVAPGDRTGSTVSGDSGAARVFPVRNVIATAVPSRSATIAIAPTSITSQPIGGVPTTQSPELSAMVSELNSQIRSIVDNMRAENQTSSRQDEDSAAPNSSVISGEVAGRVDPSNSVQSQSSEEAYPASGSSKEYSGVGEPSASLSRELPVHPESNVKDPKTSGDSAKSTGAAEVPLGLGGGLQPKKRSQQSKNQPKSGEGGTSSNVDQSHVARANGQQILQSLLTQSTHGGTTSNPPAGVGQTLQGRGQGLRDTRLGAQASDGQFDVTGMMSQLLDSPALNGLLSGVAQQTGVGSPDVLRNMIQQFSQTPAMRNTVNQLAQQVDREDLSSMFAGAGMGGSGQGGNLDLSSMFQQMMPVVSQVLGNVSVGNEQVQNSVPELPPQVDDRSFVRGSQEVVHQILGQGSAEDILGSLARNASEISGVRVDEIQEWLSSNEELVHQFMETLVCDLNHRLQEDSASGNEP